MNKNFLSLALVAAFSVSFVAVASENDKKDDKKVEAPKVVVPEYIAVSQKEFADMVETAIKEVPKAKERLDNATTERKEKKSGEDTKELDEQIVKFTKELSAATSKVAVLERIQKLVNNDIDATFNKSLMNRVTAPARWAANVIISNRIAALALEVTGVSAVLFAGYKLFFAQEEIDEDAL